MSNQIIASVSSENENLGNPKKEQSSTKPFFKNFFQSLCKCLYLRNFVSSYTIMTNNKKAIDVPQQSERSRVQFIFRDINQGKKTLVIDLDETLVHSSFQEIAATDFKFNITIENQQYTIYVKIRPGAIEFLKEMAEYYEIVIFTASINEYADPVIDFIDPNHVTSVRLYRENCTIFNNIFVKDLSSLNRDIKDIIIIDNSPHSFMFQPMNAIHICSYFDDPTDQELLYLAPFLIILIDVLYRLINQKFYDVRPVHEWWYKFIHFDRFVYTNKNGERVIFENVVQEDEKLEEGQNSIFEEESIRHLGDSELIEIKIKDQIPLEKSPLETPKPEETQKLVKRNFKLNKSNAVNRNIQFNVDDKAIRVNTEGVDIKHQTDETEVESSDIRNQLNINSPHGLESTNRQLFQSTKKQQI